jgi:hypothetical protein
MITLKGRLPTGNRRLMMANISKGGFNWSVQHPWGQNTHAAMRISARTGRRPVWCKYSNELYDIVIRQYYG